MIDGYFAFSFTLGIFAAVNPCGFVMLPAYLMYFLGLEGSRPGTQRASLQRALLVSAATSAGFISIFVIVGIISRLFTSVIEENAKYAGFVIGIALVVLGCFMLAGWKPPFASPQMGAGKERTQTFRSMFGFGVAYAVASIGCTIGSLITVVLGTFSTAGFVSGTIAVTLYGVGMALIVTALTVTLAFASGGLLRVLRSSLRYMDKLAAAFIMATGLYLMWYWYGGISERGTDGLTSRVEGWQADLVNLFNRLGVWNLLLILSIPVVAAVAYVVFSRQRDRSRPESATVPQTESLIES